MIQSRFRNQTHLLIEDEQQSRHHRQSILSCDFIHLIHWPPRNLFIAVLFPPFEITRRKISLLVIYRRLSKNWHSIRHWLQQSFRAAHFDVISAQNQRLHAPNTLLLTHRDGIQVQEDEVRNELQREAFELVLVRSIEVVELNANRMKELKREIDRWWNRAYKQRTTATYIWMFRFIVQNRLNGGWKFMILGVKGSEWPNFLRLQWIIFCQPIANYGLCHDQNAYEYI